MRVFRPSRSVLVALLTMGVAGCALGGGGLSVPAPEEIPGLEARMTSDPDDLESGLRLAAAYRGVERFDDGFALIARLSERYPDDLGVLVLTGLLAEDTGDFTAARAAYMTVLERDPGQALREQIGHRLPIVRRAELRADVVTALAREAELAQSSPDPATVGIFPFAYEGGDPIWEPLALALPDMLATDLGVTGRLRIVERVSVQALLAELALGESGRVVPASAARGGRLLGAGHVVQGRFRIDGGERIEVDLAVVEVLAPGAEQVDPVAAQDLIARLFDLEKQLAFDIHSELGIQLTPAERERINERQTESVEALLAYGRGLQAVDLGDFTLAEQSFAEAEELDPQFTLAETQLAEVQAVSAATAVAPADVPSAQALAQQRQAVLQLTSAPTSIPNQVLQDLTQPERAVLAEVTGQDRVGQVTLLELILRPPGGGGR